MDDFQFGFTWNDTDYMAQAHVEGETSRQTFTWDVPDAEPAAEYMRAVNLGLMEYLDEQEEAE